MKSESDLFIFIHIPKCAGTTLRENILLNHHAKHVLAVYKLFNPEFKDKKGIENFISIWSEERRDEIKIIIGHNVYYGIHQLFPNRNPKYITVFRNPAKRIISLYNWLRTNLERGIMVGSLDRVRHNNEIIQFGLNWYTSNKDTLQDMMSLFLYKHFYNICLSEGITDNDLEQIYLILDKFYFIGIVENKNDMDFIYHILNLRKFCGNVNISTKYAIPNEYEETLMEIEKNNQIDMKLYNYAIERNEELKTSFNNFELNVNKLQLKKKKYFKSVYYLFYRLQKYIKINRDQIALKIKTWFK